MFNKILLYTVITVHMAIVLGNVAAFFVLPFLAPWYIWIPLCTFLFWFTNERGLTCKLTQLENALRRRTSLPEIRGFVGHYLKWPLLRLWKTIRARLSDGMS